MESKYDNNTYIYIYIQYGLPGNNMTQLLCIVHILASNNDIYDTIESNLIKLSNLVNHTLMQTVSIISNIHDSNDNL